MSSPDESCNEAASAPAQWIRPSGGLRGAEVILRGGLLDAPLVVQDCVEQEGAIFMNVGAEAKHMHAMFLGSKWNRKKRPTDSYAAPSSLTELRIYRNAVGRRKLQELVQGLMKGSQPSPATSPADPEGCLDFDLEPSSGDSQASGDRSDRTSDVADRMSRKFLKAATRMLPNVVEIDVPMARGEVWTPRVVLPKEPRRAVYLEFTDENLRRLTGMMGFGGGEEVEEKAFRPGEKQTRDRKKKPRQEEVDAEGDL